MHLGAIAVKCGNQVVSPLLRLMFATLAATVAENGLHADDLENILRALPAVGGIALSPCSAASLGLEAMVYACSAFVF